jgi:ubiquinone/menaquinone biosynthesis C-methylase UbiE
MGRSRRREIELTSFREALVDRSAAVYTDFLVPHLRPSMRVLDCGCGPGSIAVGLAGAVRSVVGVDLAAATLEPATAHVAAECIPNVRFVAADGRRLPFAAEAFDAVLMHSVLEAAADPVGLVGEAFRVLVSGGLLAAASVEYGGRVLAGPQRETLERFYAVREQLWSLEGVARPRAGRDLRRLLHRAGFVGVEATAHYLSYGTEDAIRRFGEARAEDCAEPWFSSRSVAHRLLTAEEIEHTTCAWREWSQSPESFLAFAWCRVVGRKPRAGKR